MQKDFSSIKFGFALAVCVFGPASASPVTAKDLVGRKICWTNGNVSTFGAGGKYSSPVVGEGFWSIGTGGVGLQRARFNGLLDIDKQPDGTFQSQREGGAGKYCK
jgi:hypothetical protein